VGNNLKNSVLVIGAGPAGLTAAYELQKREPRLRTLVLEASDQAGGISRTETYKGYRFDIGGHRFFTKVDEVNDLWHEILGDDFIRVRRQSRIYYRDRFFDYPLKLFNALSNIGVYETFRIMASYLKWRLRPHLREDTFEEWVMNRFGGRLYMHFFRSYTEKVWGIPPSQIRSEWAAQRIKNLSLRKAVWNAVSGANDTASLIDEFSYPRLGPGMMWERAAEIIEKNCGEVRFRHEVVQLNLNGNRITSADVRKCSPDGEDLGTERVEADSFINSMALRDLINCIQPPPPQHVLKAASQLKYRDFLIVTLILNRSDPFPDNWIYVHSPDVRVGRIQNFRAWSPEMLPDAETASIGMEYFCQRDDDLWAMADDDLIALASKELEKLGLTEPSSVIDGAIIRQPKAYPVYDAACATALEVIREWIERLENFWTVGRNGLHRYNNQDHSMLTAMLAAQNVLGASHDVWSVNVERSYHEEFEVSKDEIARKIA
jgi:protoporphyrinogen oxidase